MLLLVARNELKIEEGPDYVAFISKHPESWPQVIDFVAENLVELSCTFKKTIRVVDPANRETTWPYLPTLRLAALSPS